MVEIIHGADYDWIYIITSFHSRREGKQPHAERVGAEIANLIARAIHDELPPKVRKLVAHLSTGLVLHVIIPALLLGTLCHNLQHDTKKANKKEIQGDLPSKTTTAAWARARQSRSNWMEWTRLLAYLSHFSVSVDFIVTLEKIGSQLVPKSTCLHFFRRQHKT
jgi:hypothetical protein